MIKPCFACQVTVGPFSEKVCGNRLNIWLPSHDIPGSVPAIHEVRRRVQHDWMLPSQQACGTCVPKDLMLWIHWNTSLSVLFLSFIESYEKESETSKCCAVCSKWQLYKEIHFTTIMLNCKGTSTLQFLLDMPGIQRWSLCPFSALRMDRSCAVSLCTMVLLLIPWVCMGLLTEILLQLRSEQLACMPWIGNPKLLILSNILSVALEVSCQSYCCLCWA